jgi:hypothetical protein
MNDVPQLPEDPPHLLRTLTNHPAFQLASFIIGVTGITLAVFFYFHSKHERQPWYYVQPTRTSIVDRGLAVGEKIKILYNGEPLDATNVSALQIQFWNAGLEPIRSTDVLLPIKLLLPEYTQILDLTVVKQSRPEIVKFKARADKDSSGRQTNSGTFDFTILEKNDSATVQVVYAGPPNASVQLSGAIIGAAIHRLSVPLEAEGRRSGGTLIFKIALLFYLPFPYMVFDMIETMRRRNNRIGSPPKTSIWKKKRFWVVQIPWTALSIAIYYYLFLRPEQIPPNLLM